MTETIYKILLSRRSYICFTVFVSVYAAVGQYFIYITGSADYWGHLAATFAFTRNLFHPEHPYLLTDQPTHLFTVYHFFWGAVSHIARIHPFHLLPFTAAVNTILFAVAVDRLSLSLWGSIKYSLVLALTLLFVWFRPLHYSGVYDFGQFPVTAVYPFWFAFPLSLICIAEFREHLAPYKYLLFLAGISVVIMVHPLTGSFVSMAIFIKSWLFRETPVHKRLLFSLIPVPAIFLAFAWPFFPVAQTMFGYNKLSFNASEFSFLYKRGVYPSVFAILAGAAWAVIAVRKRNIDFIVAGFTAAVLLFLVNFWTLKNSYFARYFIYFSFFGHLSVVSFFKQFEDNKRLVMLFSLCVLALAGLEVKDSLKQFGIVSDLRYKAPPGSFSNLNIFKKMTSLQRHLRTNDVVMTYPDQSWQLPAIVGCKVVSISQPIPFIDDLSERSRCMDSFFNRETSIQQKLAIANKYRVTFILSEDPAIMRDDSSHSFIPVMDDGTWHLLKRRE